MLFSEFDSLVGCRTPEYEDYVPMKAYKLVLSRLFKVSVCIALATLRLADFQFNTSAMVYSEFDSLVSWIRIYAFQVRPWTLLTVIT